MGLCLDTPGPGPSRLLRHSFQFSPHLLEVASLGVPDFEDEERFGDMLVALRRFISRRTHKTTVYDCIYNHFSVLVSSF